MLGAAVRWEMNEDLLQMDVWRLGGGVGLELELVTCVHLYGKRKESRKFSLYEKT